jgi:hypothetical protein
MPAGIGGNIPPAQILEAFVAVSRLNSPLEILLWRQGKERYAPIPPPVAEGPAYAEKFQKN